MLTGCILDDALCHLHGWLHTKDAEGIKAFITRQYEDWTPKFREFNTVFARRLIFIGTTNEPEFLSDRTGNRRWLPVTVGKVDTDGIVADRDQLWAEALVLWMVTGVDYSEAQELAKEVHGDHFMSDSIEEIIADWLETPDPLTGIKPRTRKSLQVSEVLKDAVKVEPGRTMRGIEMKVGAILRTFGYERERFMDSGVRKYLYVKHK